MSLPRRWRLPNEGWRYARSASPAYLLFLSGLEIDSEWLGGRILRLTSVGFAVSFAIAVVLGLALKAGGFVKSPL